MKTIIKILIAAAVINAVARGCLAASRYYELKDDTQQALTFGGQSPTDQIQNQILESADRVEPAGRSRQRRSDARRLRTTAAVAVYAARRGSFRATPIRSTSDSPLKRWRSRAAEPVVPPLISEERRARVRIDRGVALELERLCPDPRDRRRVVERRQVDLHVHPRAAQPREQQLDRATPTSLVVLRLPLAATTTAPRSACWQARIVSSGASVAARSGAIDGLFPRRLFRLRTPWSAGRPLSPACRPRCPGRRARAMRIAKRMQARRGFGQIRGLFRCARLSLRQALRPCISSDVPTAPASAAAEPPPGTASVDENASDQVRAAPSDAA